MSSLILIMVLVAILVILWFVLPFLGTRRAIPKIIEVLRQEDAVGKRNAKPLEELIPRPSKQNWIKMMFAPRDYRLPALLSLLKKNIVQKTEDGRLYLSEKDLADSKWRGH